MDHLNGVNVTNLDLEFPFTLALRNIFSFFFYSLFIYLFIFLSLVQTNNDLQSTIPNERSFDNFFNNQLGTELQGNLPYLRNLITLICCSVATNGPWLLRAHDCNYRESLARLKKSKILIICLENPLREIYSKNLFQSLKN